MGWFLESLLLRQLSEGPLCFDWLGLSVSSLELRGFLTRYGIKRGEGVFTEN